MPVCDVCGKVVKDLRRHKERGRCGAKREKRSLPASFVPGTPESRLAMDSTLGPATLMGTGEPADFVNEKKRLKEE
ncbi:MAG TPA: hypothetical protein VMS77_02620 [Conexivisphaerales archaeon]|nr:hypothetical protein [Conexivisphaerales archaeon]